MGALTEKEVHVQPVLSHGLLPTGEIQKLCLIKNCAFNGTFCLTCWASMTHLSKKRPLSLTIAISHAPSFTHSHFPSLNVTHSPTPTPTHAHEHAHAHAHAHTLIISPSFSLTPTVTSLRCVVIRVYTDGFVWCYCHQNVGVFEQCHTR